MEEEDTGIIILEGALSPEVCAQWIAEIDGSKMEPALVGQYNRLNTQIRQCDRSYMDNDQAKLTMLWNAVEPHIHKFGRGEAVRLNSRIRCLRYVEGGFFKVHRDANYEEDNLRSYLTVQVYLNDGFVGGDLVFESYNTGEWEKRIRPKAGSIVLFDQTLWHRAEKVTKGVKYAMRTEVMFKVFTKVPVAVEVSKSVSEVPVAEVAEEEEEREDDEV